MLNIIPSDSASIFSVLSAAQTLALVRPSNPPPGLAGFLFDIDGDDLFRMRSQISQHFVEDNTTIQDQIALEPERVVLRRLVAEVVYTKPTVPPISATPNPLPLNPAMQPMLTPGALQLSASAAAAAASANSAVTSTQSLWGYYVGKAGQQPNQTRQSIVFGYLYQLWLGRQLFTVETPWGVMINMAIETNDMEQPEETATKTECNITFQKIRFAQPAQTTVGQVAGRAAFQQSPMTQNGTAGSAPVSASEQSSILQQIMYPPTN